MLQYLKGGGPLSWFLYYEASLTRMTFCFIHLHLEPDWFISKLRLSAIIGYLLSFGIGVFNEWLTLILVFILNSKPLPPNVR